MPQRVLCLWFPNWPIQRLEHAVPELRDQMVLLTNVRATAANVTAASEVVACSHQAWQIGIRPAMPLAEAQTLLGTRTVTIRTDDGVADRRALEKLAHQCQSFSPLVGLEDRPRPQSLLLEIAGSSRLFGGEQQLVDELAARLSREKYVFSAAIANSVGAAWAAAHYFSANLAAAPADPAAIAATRPIIIPHHSVGPLRGLPIGALRLAPPTVDLLHQLGIVTMDQLLQLPRSSLVRRFGQEILQRLDQMLGRAEEPIHACHAPRDLRAVWSLEHATTDRRLLTHIVSLLVEQIAQQLDQCAGGAILIVCHLQIVDQQPLEIRAGLYQPSARAAHLCELLEVHFESLTVTGPIEQVEVSVPIWGRLRPAQCELFEDDSHATAEQLGVLVNRLSSRLGEAAVVRVELEDHAEPERAYRRQTLTGQSSPRAVQPSSRSRPAQGRPRKNPSSRRETSRGLPRPLLLYRTPRPLEVVCLAPAGPPQYFWQHAQRWQIASYWGPERIETGWWRGATLRRDYYRIETEQGCWYWIFRCLRSGRWFGHGEFV